MCLLSVSNFEQSHLLSDLVVMLRSGSCQAVIRQSSGSCQAVIKWSSGSHQAVVRQFSNCQRLFSLVLSYNVKCEKWQLFHSNCLHPNVQCSLWRPLSKSWFSVTNARCCCCWEIWSVGLFFAHSTDYNQNLTFASIRRIWLKLLQATCVLWIGPDPQKTRHVAT